MSRVAFVLVVLAAVAAGARADQYRDALMDLYTATNGAAWTNNAGWGTSANYCTWFGVSCPLHTTADITGLKLTGNNLAGSVPATLGAWPALCRNLCGGKCRYPTTARMECGPRLTASLCHVCVACGAGAQA